MHAAESFRADRAPKTRPAWFVVFTSPRCEARALEGMKAAGFEAFLPMHRRRVRHHRVKRLVWKEAPLFTRYVFAGLDATAPDFFGLRQVDGVQSIVAAAGRPLPIATEVVEQLRELETAGAFTEDRSQRRFQHGERLIVRGGPLTGLHVSFDELRGQGAAQVLLRLFGTERAATIALDDLGAATGSAEPPALAA